MHLLVENPGQDPVLARGLARNGFVFCGGGAGRGAGGEPGQLKKRAAIAEAISAVHAAAPESDDAGLFALYLAGTPFAEADARKAECRRCIAVEGVAGGERGERRGVDRRLPAARRYGCCGLRSADGFAWRRPARTAELTLADVAEAFAGMAVAKTTAIRAALVEGLLRRATPLEAKYLLKLMLGDMRIGVKQSLVEEAIAVAANASGGGGAKSGDAGGGSCRRGAAGVCRNAGRGADAAVSSARVHAGVAGRDARRGGGAVYREAGEGCGAEGSEKHARERRGRGCS